MLYRLQRRTSISCSVDATAVELTQDNVQVHGLMIVFKVCSTLIGSLVRFVSHPTKAHCFVFGMSKIAQLNRILLNIKIILKRIVFYSNADVFSASAYKLYIYIPPNAPHGMQMLGFLYSVNLVEYQSLCSRGNWSCNLLLFSVAFSFFWGE